MFAHLLALLGIEANTTGHTEKIVSGIGGFVGIFAVAFVSAAVVSGPAVPMMVASMGASAVLLFATPHGKLAQPWNLVGGHLVSAVIGVTCATWIADPLLAGAAAVGVAISAMYYLRCIHPPGGATALVAVIGGPSIHALGYDYVLVPVGLNVLIILLVALGMNYLFSWRRYPAHLFRLLQSVPAEEPGLPVLSAVDLDYALRQIGSYVDVTGEELATIYRLAEHHAQSDHVPVDAIRLGHYYSNGKYGAEWAVRRVVDEGHGEGDEVLLIYKVVAGNGRRSTGTCSRLEFARWAKHEVYLNENSWQRVAG